MNSKFGVLCKRKYPRKLIVLLYSFVFIQYLSVGLGLRVCTAVGANSPHRNRFFFLPLFFRVHFTVTAEHSIHVSLRHRANKPLSRNYGDASVRNAYLTFIHSLYATLHSVSHYKGHLTSNLSQQSIKISASLFKASFCFHLDSAQNA